MVRKYLFQIIGLTLLLSCTEPSVADDKYSLSVTENEIALKAESDQYLSSRNIAFGIKSRQPLETLVDKRKSLERKSVVVSILPVGSRSTNQNLHKNLNDDGNLGRRAVVSRFEYASGETIRTWVDLESGDIIAARSDINYPTPLSPEELQEAISLIRASLPLVNEAFESADTIPIFHHLVPTAPNKTAPRFGHRLVIFWLTDPIVTEKYMIDLSTEEVFKAP